MYYPQYPDNCCMSPPQIVGEFSVDHDQSLRFDDSNARYLDWRIVRNPNVRLNLNIGYESFDNSRAPPEVGFEAMTSWIMNNARHGDDVQSAALGADVVCFRGILKKIAATPYSTAPWSFVAIKKGGVIFICEQDCDGVPKSPYLDRACYWGCKFEKCLQINPETNRHYTHANVVFGDQYRAVVETTIGSGMGSTRVLYCGEVDGLDDDGDFVEMKTQATSLNDNFWHNKARDTYIQCKLLGVEQVIVGLRNKGGMLHGICELPTEELLERGIGWDYDTCIEYLSNMLLRVRSLLENNGEMCYFDFDGKGCSHSDAFVAHRSGFLSDEFAAFIRSRRRFRGYNQ